MAKKSRPAVRGGKRQGKAKIMDAQVVETPSTSNERGPRKVLILDRPDGSGYIVMLDVPGTKQYVLQVPPESGRRMMMDVFKVVVKYGVEYGAPITSTGIAGGRKY
jgi:alkylation response protein AidB-like acyl-CoA dehydrogenase